MQLHEQIGYFKFQQSANFSLETEVNDSSCENEYLRTESDPLREQKDRPSERKRKRNYRR